LSSAPRATAIDVASAGEDVPLLEGIRTARAIRRLRPDPVPRELIRKVCEAGTFAPSGGNRQPWIFVAVSEPERRAWVAERYRNAFREYIAPVLGITHRYVGTEPFDAVTENYNLDMKHWLQGAQASAEPISVVETRSIVLTCGRTGFRKIFHRTARITYAM